MKVTICISGEFHDVDLYDLQYWGRRLFCYGNVKGTKTRFVSTACFTDLLMQYNIGKPYRFTGIQKYNPYLCKNETIGNESGNDALRIIDVGPKEFSGLYINVRKLGEFIDNVYFETVEFEKPDFDLYEYQNDEAYRFSRQSGKRDALPKLYSKYRIPLFGKLKVIHGVAKISEDHFEDFFDCFSLNEMLGMDMGVIDKSSINVLNYHINQVKNYPSLKFFVKFCHHDFINNLFKDGGNDYIKRNLVKDRTVRKYTFRHIYEYNKLRSHLTRRIRFSKPAAKASNVWSYKLMMHGVGIYNSNEYEFVFYKNSEQIMPGSASTRLNEVIVDQDNQLLAEPIFTIRGYFDFINMKLKFHDFDKKELLELLEDKGYLTASISLKKYIAKIDKFSSINGMLPKILEIEVSRTPDIDRIRCYIIKDQPFFINLLDLFKVFGQHDAYVRESIKIGKLSRRFAIENIRIKHDFVIYDVAKNVFDKPKIILSDCELDTSMIKLYDALMILKDFETSERTSIKQAVSLTEKGIRRRRVDARSDFSRKSGIWYLNANRLALLELGPSLEATPWFDANFPSFEPLEEV